MNAGKFIPFCALLLVCSCDTTTHVGLGKTRPPTNPASVKIYLHPPAKYEEIAIVNTDSNFAICFSDQEKVDAAIGRAKKEAAKLGANGLLVNTLGGSGSFTAAPGGAANPANYAPGVTQGGWVKTFSGVAIFVTEE